MPKIIIMAKRKNYTPNRLGSNTTMLMTPWGGRVASYVPPKKFRGGSGERFYTPKAPSERLSLKHKVASSRTLTRTKTKKKGWNDNDTNGIKYQSHAISYKKSKISRTTEKLSQPGNVYEYDTGGATSGQSIQAFSEVCSTYGVDLTQLYIALQNAATVNTLRISSQLYLSGTKDEIEFMNCSPTTMEFEIYVLIDKITAASAPNPSTVWSTAISQESNDVTGQVETLATPWIKPTGYKFFNMNFWTRRFPCVLTPGEKCKFTLNFKRNRKLDTSYIANYTGSIRGITHRIWVLQRGTLTDGTNAKTVADNDQSLSETKLVWLHKSTTYGSILGNYPRVSKNIGVVLPTPAAQWVIDEDGGEPENVGVGTEFA